MKNQVLTVTDETYNKAKDLVVVFNTKTLRELTTKLINTEWEKNRETIEKIKALQVSKIENTNNGSNNNSIKIEKS